MYPTGWVDAGLQGYAALSNDILPKSMKITFYRRKSGFTMTQIVRESSGDLKSARDRERPASVLVHVHQVGLHRDAEVTLRESSQPRASQV